DLPPPGRGARALAGAPRGRSPLHVVPDLRGRGRGERRPARQGRRRRGGEARGRGRVRRGDPEDRPGRNPGDGPHRPHAAGGASHGRLRGPGPRGGEGPEAAGGRRRAGGGGLLLHRARGHPRRSGGPHHRAALHPHHRDRSRGGLRRPGPRPARPPRARPELQAQVRQALPRPPRGRDPRGRHLPEGGEGADVPGRGAHLQGPLAAAGRAPDRALWRREARFMIVARTREELAGPLAELRARGERLALVPTMGFLHEGHLSLVRPARELADRVALTIFANPAQFGPNEDLDRYPRDLEGDLEKCRKEGVWMVFAPSDPREVYRPGHSTWVNVEGPLVEGLCGASRPGHFRGVATVVLKLFHLFGPDVALFGKK